MGCGCGKKKNQVYVVTAGGETKEFTTPAAAQSWANSQGGGVVRPVAKARA